MMLGWCEIDFHDGIGIGGRNTHLDVGVGFIWRDVGDRMEIVGCRTCLYEVCRYQGVQSEGDRRGTAHPRKNEKEKDLHLRLRFNISLLS